MLPKTLKNFIQVLQVCVKIWGVDNNIIKIHKERFSYLAVEAPLHKVLKCHQNIAQAKWHELELKQA